MSDKRPSIKDVAEKAGVSYTTVSHVINKTRYVSPEVVEKVNSAMKELNYRRNTIAQSLRKSKSYVIGIIVPNLVSDFYKQVINGIESVLYKNNYNISFAFSKENQEVEKKQLEMFASWQVDGIIIAPTSDSFQLANPGGICDCPVVCIDRIPKDTLTDSVETNCREISKEAVFGLYEKGYKKIAFATCRPDLYPSHERMVGYIEAIQELGLGEPVVFYPESHITAGERLAEEIVNRGDISAVLIDNLPVNIGAMKYFVENDIKVPDTIAVVGYDDSIWAYISNPPLTAVHQDAERFGKRTAEILLERIENPECEIKHEILNGTICWRKTT